MVVLFACDNHFSQLLFGTISVCQEFFSVAVKIFCVCVVIYLFILHYRPRVGIVHPWRVCVSQLLRPPSKHCSDQQGQISYSGSLDPFWVGGEKPSRRSSSKWGSAIRLEITSAPISLKHLWAAIFLSPTLPPASLLEKIIKVIYMN